MPLKFLNLSFECRGSGEKSSETMTGQLLSYTKNRLQQVRTSALSPCFPIGAFKGTVTSRPDVGTFVGYVTSRSVVGAVVDAVSSRPVVALVSFSLVHVSGSAVPGTDVDGGGVGMACSQRVPL